MVHSETSNSVEKVEGESSTDLSKQWLRMYEQMLKIRVFEEHVNVLYLSAKMPGLAHLYTGEEAVAVGVCEALRRNDYITSTHRGHGHCLAKGASIDRMFAELLGKEAGYCRGKGGSMHIADQETGNLGANAIVAGSTALATGAAMSSKMQGTDQVTEGLWYRDRRSGWAGCTDCLRNSAKAGRASSPGRRPSIHALQYIPLSRTSCGRYSTIVLPFKGRRAVVDDSA